MAHACDCARGLIDLGILSKWVKEHCQSCLHCEEHLAEVKSKWLEEEETEFEIAWRQMMEKL